MNFGGLMLIGLKGFVIVLGFLVGVVMFIALLLLIDGIVRSIKGEKK